MPYNTAGVQLDNGFYYHRYFNLSSIFNPDPQNNTDAQTVQNYASYMPYYSKFLVHGAKVRGYYSAIGANGASNSSFQPVDHYMWVNNIKAVDVTNAMQAENQPGVRNSILNTNPYSNNMKWFKAYYNIQKQLKRKLDEDEDYGQIFNAATSGQDPSDDACLFLHMLWKNNSSIGAQTSVYLNFKIVITYYVKLWDQATAYATATMDPDD